MIPTVRLFALVVLLAGVAGAAGAEPRPIGTFRDWTAFVDEGGNAKICYVGSVPKKAEGAYTKRGETYVLVTHRPADKTFGEVSVEAGYAYKSGSEVTVVIGGQSFRLFTQNRGDGNGNAWAYDAQSDKAVVEAMKKGSELVVKGTSTRGTETTDTYSLLGFSAALDAITKACGG